MRLVWLHVNGSLLHKPEWCSREMRYLIYLLSIGSSFAQNTRLGPDYDEGEFKNPSDFWITLCIALIHFIAPALISSKTGEFYWKWWFVFFGGFAFSVAFLPKSTSYFLLVYVVITIYGLSQTHKNGDHTSGQQDRNVDDRKFQGQLAEVNKAVVRESFEQSQSSLGDTSASTPLTQKKNPTKPKSTILKRVNDEVADVAKRDLGLWFECYKATKNLSKRNDLYLSIRVKYLIKEVEKIGLKFSSYVAQDLIDNLPHMSSDEISVAIKASRPQSLP